MTKILDRVNNLIGTFVSASATVPTGTKTATVAGDMPAAELTDPTNTLRIGIEADFGHGFVFQGWGPVWTGDAGQTAPSFSWQFNPSFPPLRVRGVLENITQTVCGLTIAFA